MPARQGTLTPAGLRFAAKWIEEKYWRGQPLLKAAWEVKTHLGLTDPIGDKLDERRRLAHAAENRARSALKMAGQWLETCQRAIMEKDLTYPGRSTFPEYQDLSRAELALQRRRQEYHKANRAHIYATRQWAAWCQGYMCNA